jgi:hypothetical protein
MLRGKMNLDPWQLGGSKDGTIWRVTQFVVSRSKHLWPMRWSTMETGREAVLMTVVVRSGDVDRRQADESWQRD